MATPVCSSILSDLGFVRLEQRTPERLDSDYTQRSRRDIGISDFSDFALNKGLIYVSPLVFDDVYGVMGSSVTAGLGAHHIDLHFYICPIG